jgi:wyosine [tRNA(Phe)-imidazoG37] synthetase (radical SAM superfamily)
MQRDEYTPTQKIKEELDQYLSSGPTLDHITFSGSGEPLLHNRINDIICFLNKEYPQYRIALLTNTTLLGDLKVREDIADIDIVKASIDTTSEETFIQLNRPHPDLHIATMIDNLISFREMFQHQLWFEFFLVPGLNDNEDEIKSIKMAIKAIRPDRVHVNSLDRPGSEKWVKAVRQETLKEIEEYMGHVDSVTQRKFVANDKKCDGIFHQHLISTIRRRPCTAEDVSKVLGTHFSETKNYLELLSKKGEIEKYEMPRGIFYIMKS